MTAGFEISEDDRRLIHALQLSPRASWTDLAPALGHTPSALSRRWERLSSAGVAWNAGIVTPGSFERRSAIIEVDADPGEGARIREELCHWGSAFTIDVSASGGTLIVSLYATSDEMLTELLLESIPALGGVRDIRAHVLTHLQRTAETWTLRALTPQEALRVPRQRPPRPRAPKSMEPEFTLAVCSELAKDGRAPLSVLARRLGVGEQKAADAVAAVLHSGHFLQRTEIMNSASGWPVHLWYFAEVPPRHLEPLARALGAQPDVRFVTTCAGPANLVFNVWLKDLRSVHQLETQVTTISQAGVQLRRHFILNTPKRQGHLLTRDGRATGTYVPFVT